MTDNSAELYDTQVEVLFNGSANAIRRQAIPQLHEVFAGRDQREHTLCLGPPVQARKHAEKLGYP